MKRAAGAWWPLLLGLGACESPPNTERDDGGPSAATTPASRPVVETGLERLVAGGFAPLAGKTVGAVVNQTAVDARGRHLIDLLAASDAVQLKVLFGPEHGVRGRHVGPLADGKDPDSGVPVISLYSKDSRRPKPESLAGLDAVLFDLQDVGARFYTFISTMSALIDVAARTGVEVVILDRPNPLGGTIVEGPVLEPGRESFVGVHPIALRHGMTIGELARMFVGEGWVGKGHDPRITVVEMRGWRRSMLWPQTELRWVRPSPNMPDFETALVYPAICLIEGTTLSEGRGTETPFLLLGAPWVKPSKLLARLATARPAGVEFSTAVFTPRAIAGRAARPKHARQRVQGIRLAVTDAAGVRDAPILVHLFAALLANGDGRDFFKAKRFDRLAGNSWLREGLQAGAAAAELLGRMEREARRFERLRAPYLLYR